LHYVPLGVVPGVALGAPRGVPLGVVPGVALGAPRGVPLGVAPGVPLGAPRGVPLGVAPGVPLGSLDTGYWRQGNSHVHHIVKKLAKINKTRAWHQID